MLAEINPQFGITASELKAFLATKNVHVMAVGIQKIRMITHLDVGDLEVESLLTGIDAFLESI